LANLKKQLQQTKKQISQAKNRQQQGRDQQTQLNNLLAFAEFAQLDWRREAAHAQQLTAQKARLEQSSDRLQQLQAELTQIQGQITAVTEERHNQARTFSQLEYQIGSYLQDIDRAKEDIREADDEAMAQYAPRIKAQVTVAITLKNVDRLWREIITHFRQASDSEQRRANTFMGRLLKLMQEYKDAYPAETADFDAAVESMDAN
jgi:uncharacterized protein YPO0396